MNSTLSIPTPLVSRELPPLCPLNVSESPTTTILLRHIESRPVRPIPQRLPPHFRSLVGNVRAWPSLWATDTLLHLDGNCKSRNIQAYSIASRSYPDSDRSRPNYLSLKREQTDNLGATKFFFQKILKKIWWRTSLREISNHSSCCLFHKTQVVTNT